MPVCPVCDNRLFSTKEALLQHMKSSSAWHPFCAQCDRRFVSNDAYEAHMVAKHPVTFDCVTCARSFHAQFALEDHYRGSSIHPNCPVCGKGFFDHVANDEHHRTSHPRVPCIPCGGKIFYEEALESHYTSSPNHPKCESCMKGFKDRLSYAEHMLHSHPELRCDACTRQFDSLEDIEVHYLSSASHPKCNQCGMGLKDEEALAKHTEETHSVQQHPVVQEPVEELYSTGFTPLNPVNPAKLLIAGERRSDSPALSLHTNFMSPIKDVPPLFSPIGLPKPSKVADQLWASRENIQISPPAPAPSPHAPERPVLQSTSNSYSPRMWASRENIQISPPAPAPPQHALERPVLQITSNSYSPPTRNDFGIKTRPRSESDVLIEEAFSPILEQLPDDQFPTTSSTSSAQAFSPPSKFATPISPPQRDSISLRGGVTFNPRPPLPQSSRHFSPPLQFNSRLYPGSVRAAAAARAAQASTSYHGPYMQGSGYRSQSTHSLASVSSLGTRDSDSSSLMRTRPPPPISDQSVDWNSLLGDREYSSKAGTRTRSVLSEAPTPRMETPLRHTISLVNHGSLPSPSATRSTSPSSAADYSPPSAFDQPDTRPTTASSTQAPLLITYPSTASSSSDCGRSPISPEVESPEGLLALPRISPLITTPIDLTYDIPEAHQPLPASPIASAMASPQTVILGPGSTSHTPSPSEPKSKASSEDSVTTQVQQPLSDPEPRMEIQANQVQFDEQMLWPFSMPTSTRSPILSPVSPAKEEFQSAKPSPMPEWAMDPEPEPAVLALDLEMPPITFQEEMSEAKVVLDSHSSSGTARSNKSSSFEFVESPGKPEAQSASPPVLPGGEVPEPSPNPTSILHCRLCKRNTCNDITATMCGHIFCYGCITDHIIKTPRCPVCATPTLLYCLFRLDLKA